MPTLLEEALVEADALKEAAKQRAEAELVEKYSSELDKKIGEILEEQVESRVYEAEDDELDLDAALGADDDLGGMDFEDDLDITDDSNTDYIDKQVPYSFSDGENMCPCEDEDEEIEINFNDLVSQGDEGGVEDREDFIEDVSDDEEEFLEEIDLSSFGLEEAVLEELVVDTDGDSNGWAPEPAAHIEKEIDQFLSNLMNDKEKTTSPKTGRKDVTKEVGPINALQKESEDWSEWAKKDFELEPEEGEGEQDDSFAADLPFVDRDTNPDGSKSDNYKKKYMKENSYHGMKVSDRIAKASRDAAHYAVSKSEFGTIFGTDMANEVAEDLTYVIKAQLMRDFKSLSGDGQKGPSLEESNKNLKNNLNKSKKYNKQFQEKLQEAVSALRSLSLENDKLRYQKSVLENTSLNERQKSQIVDAISRTQTVNEAKAIFDLQETAAVSTLKENRVRTNDPISEALSRRPRVSLNIARKQEDLKESKVDPVKERMQKLAGIKS